MYSGYMMMTALRGYRTISKEERCDVELQKEKEKAEAFEAEADSRPAGKARAKDIMEKIK